MKRFLLLFCTAVLVCSIMVVPAFASENIFSTEFSENTILFPSSVSPGMYTFEFLCGSDSFSPQLLYSDPFYVGEFIPIVIEGNAYLGFTTEPFYAFISGDDELQHECSLLFISGVDNGVEACACLLTLDGELYSFLDSLQYEFSLIPHDNQPVTGGSPLSGIFDVFGGVGSWIVGQFGTTTSLFWNGQGLTFLGVLSVCALALAVVLLLVFVIVRFLRFRG